MHESGAVFMLEMPLFLRIKRNAGTCICSISSR